MSSYPEVTITVTYAGRTIEIRERHQSFVGDRSAPGIAAALLASAVRRAVGAFGPEIAEAAKAVADLASALGVRKEGSE